MRRTALLLLAAAFAGCAKKEAQVVDTAAAVPPPPPPPPALAIADVVGKWTVKVMPEAGDSVILTYELNATADSTGWTITLPGNKVVPVHVGTVAGDSIVTHAGPYDSALRKGVKVSTESIMRLKDGKLVGTSTAHYNTSKPDSVVHLRTEGTKAP